MNIAKTITEFKNTEFYENYRPTDWLLNQLMEIEIEHKKEITALKEKIVGKKASCSRCYDSAYDCPVCEKYNERRREIEQIFKDLNKKEDTNEKISPTNNPFN